MKRIIVLLGAVAILALLSGCAGSATIESKPNPQGGFSISGSVNPAPTTAPASTPAPTAAPAASVKPKDLGSITVNAANPWPVANPFATAKSAEVVKCQYAVGQYDPDGQTRWFNLEDPNGYNEMKIKCLTGIAWFKDGTPQGVTFENAGTTAVVTNCASLTGRDARLDCATNAYYAAEKSGKLAGVKAMLSAMGVIWDDLNISDPFQPDHNPTDHGPRIWGVLVKGNDIHVSGNSCLVTDVPGRIAISGWKFLDSRYNPPVGHYGEASTTSGMMVEVAIHLDCTDWVEIRQAMTNAGFTPQK